MKFAIFALKDAEGAVLAHSQAVSTGRIRKGTVLTPDHLDRLKDAGIAEVMAARLDASDVPEDIAARRIGERLAAPGLSLTKAFTGRANLVAGQAGVVSVSADVIVGVNAIHESITLATLPDMMRVDEGQLVATIKIIPYGVDGACLKAVLDLLDESPIRLHPFKTMRVQLVLTHTPGFKDSLLTKGADVVRTRIKALGASLQTTTTVPHNKDDISAALDPAMDLILILGASATSDRSDVIPAAIVEAGGRVDRFGMPVDPGNLLVLGDLGGTPVVGLPGCARSPAMNGVDWVLERIAARLPIDGNAIAQMGVGGLLKEMPGRPQPREP